MHQRTEKSLDTAQCCNNQGERERKRERETERERKREKRQGNTSIREQIRA